MRDAKLALLIHNITTGYVINTDVPGTYRILKRFLYHGDALERAISDISQQLNSVGVHYIILNSGVHDAPSIPFKGYGHLKDSSHYWVDVKIVDPL